MMTLNGNPSTTFKTNVVAFPSGVPVTVIGNVPSGVVASVATVSCIVHVVVQNGDANDAVAPDGNPDAAKATETPVPAESVAVMSLERDDPRMMVRSPEFVSK